MNYKFPRYNRSYISVLGNKEIKGLESRILFSAKSARLEKIFLLIPQTLVNTNAKVGPRIGLYEWTLTKCHGVTARSIWFISTVVWHQGDKCHCIVLYLSDRAECTSP